MSEHSPEDDVQQRPEDIPEHDPASVTDVPVGEPTPFPVVGQPWQPILLPETPLHGDPVSGFQKPLVGG